ncbi:uncharacterized protein G2W53_042391 [Senna tora]|uniref:Uncharacterized protein n=1 Tax=Senna tora TaxID=362788 RepID=A0A834SIR6_9FABA|nr:uncharacterized protein G2W53_042391 [Senna tora]
MKHTRQGQRATTRKAHLLSSIRSLLSNSSSLMESAKLGGGEGAEGAMSQIGINRETATMTVAMEAGAAEAHFAMEFGNAKWRTPAVSCKIREAHCWATWLNLSDPSEAGGRKV